MQKFPLITLVVGYWALGNRQIFYNVIKQKTNSSYPIDTGHDSYLPPNIDHTCMFIVILMFFIILYGTQYYYGDNALKDDQFVDEDADKYYNTLPGITQKRLYTRECYHLAEFGNKTMSEDAFEQLRVSKQKGQLLVGDPNYQILLNQDYQKMFFYKPLDHRLTFEDYEQSDFCLRMLNIRLF